MRRAAPATALSVALVAVAAGAWNAGCSAEVEHRPNVVLLMIDTLRADKLGSYGFELPTSPELDALAARGVRFTNVVAPSSWTRPSAASLLTGLHPRTLGIYDEVGDSLADRFVTLAEILDAHGYTTLGVTANANLNSSFHFDQGFDRYVDSHVRFHFMDSPEDEASDEASDETSDYGETRLRSARQVFDTAFELLRDAGSDPVYLQLNIMEPHEYARGDLSLTRDEFRDDFAAADAGDYLGAVRQASVDTAAFVDRLAATPGWHDALFVILSDHGEGLDDHPSLPGSEGHGHFLYPSQIAVPLILHSRDWRPSRRVVERPVRLLDVAPTILDHLGIEPPGEIAGRSLMPLVDGSGEDPLPQRFVVETRFRDASKIAVYAGNWVYVENRDDWEGVDPRELQRRGEPMDGSRTDVLERTEEVGRDLARFLAAWEEQHPETPPTSAGRPLSEQERRQLEAIGYLQ